jgi:hypothetical protein
MYWLIDTMTAEFEGFCLGDNSEIVHPSLPPLFLCFVWTNRALTVVVPLIVDGTAKKAKQIQCSHMSGKSEIVQPSIFCNIFVLCCTEPSTDCCRWLSVRRKSAISSSSKSAASGWFLGFVLQENGNMCWRRTDGYGWSSVDQQVVLRPLLFRSIVYCLVFVGVNQQNKQTSVYQLW